MEANRIPALKTARLRRIGWALCLAALAPLADEAAGEIMTADTETIAPRTIGEGPYGREVIGKK